MYKSVRITKNCQLRLMVNFCYRDTPARTTKNGELGLMVNLLKKRSYRDKSARTTRNGELRLFEKKE